MSAFRDKMIYFLARKNWGVKREYEPFIASHPEYNGHKFKKLWILFRLNVHYRIFRCKKPLLMKNIGKQRLPYLNGSESEAFKRQPVVHFVKKLITYDVVSFDIFDTLILRPFRTPQDLFIVVGNKLKQLNFKKIRSEAEREAREEMKKKSGTNEVTIYDIYQIVSKKTGIDVELGVKAELETEKEFCFANPYMMQVYKILKEQGKEIVITSDMYIPHDMMEELLQSCGYTGYSKLYVSCDYKKSKRSLELYSVLKEDYKGKTIVHVGDNVASDIQAAEKSGITSVYYKNCHQIGNPYRAEDMSDPIGSFYAGLVNTHLHNGIKTYNPYYEYGFIYGGLYITGFCNWIHKRAKEQGIEKILFLARDGDIYQKVFNNMFDDIPNEYFYWSRIANFKHAIKFNKEDFITRITSHKALYSAVPSTIKEVLSSFRLEEMVTNLSKYGLNEQDLLTKENLKEFTDFICGNFEQIEKIYEKSSEKMKWLLEKTIGKCKKIAIVDVGWIGTGALGLRYLIEEKYNFKCKIIAMQVGAKGNALNYYYNTNEVLSETIQPYVFSTELNKDLYKFHLSWNRGLNGFFFEILTQSTEPSFAGISEDGDFLFDVPDFKNRKIIEEMHKGIMDFSKLYIKFSAHNTYLRNISGVNAYKPFIFAVKDLDLIRSTFKNFTLSRNIGVDSKSQKLETIEELMKQGGVIK